MKRISGNVTLGLSLLLVSVPAMLLAGLLRKSEGPAAHAVETTAAGARITPRKPQKFNPAMVVDLARRLAASPQRPRGALTPGLSDLNYVQYREIHFRVDQALWSDEKLPFRLDPLPAGFVYTAPVSVSIVDDGVAQEILADPSMFEFGNNVPKALQTQPLSLSGFRLRTRLNSRNYWDEFLVFQGASYFRAVGRGQLYGLSARGLALRTAEPEGEEFPAFTQFWIEKPAPTATSIVVHALLDSPSVTGAYRFTITPGQETTMDVAFTLFPRVDLKNVGVAPLTSMFLFDGSNHTRFDDFRLRVHDSDGLMFESQTGERVWRQLANPRNLQLSSFTSDRPRAFGLMQRARLLADFQDLEANYERRPSAWVEFPDDEAAPGPLRLVEIPTANETNDNIVAFWQPKDALPARKPYNGNYRLSWTAESLLPGPKGKFVATRIGTNFKGDRKLMVLDLTDAGTSPEGLTLDVVASTGKVSDPVIQTNPVIKGLRATFEFDPAGAQLIEFRAVVRKGDEPVSETWLYRWTG